MRCWQCATEVPAGLARCPACGAALDAESIEAMATVGEGHAPGAPIAPGVVINDRYEVRREIGRGGMGVVYLAWDRALDEPLAIRTVPPELAASPRAMAELKAELQTARTLTHEHLVRVHHLELW